MNESEVKSRKIEGLVRVIGTLLAKRRYIIHITAKQQTFELNEFKEYYGMPRGHEHDPIYSLQYLRALFGSIFFKVFLQKDCNGKKRSLCRVWM